MADLSTNYLGLKLKNPIIASSSTLTDNVKSIKELENNGASAIVLRSIFEEEITLESEDYIRSAVEEGYDEGLFDYYDKKVKQNNVANYLTLIKDAKKEVTIPIIASINCMSNMNGFTLLKKLKMPELMQLNLICSSYQAGSIKHARKMKTFILI